MRVWLVLLLTIGTALHADTIIRTDPKKKVIAMVFDEPKEFEIDEHVCIKRQDISIACGDIFKTTEKGALVYLFYGIENVSPGMHATLVSGRSLPRSRVLLVGVNYRFPEVQFQQLFASRWSYGILCEGIILRNGDLSLKGFGTMMTLSYYGGSLFKGFWAMAGAGLHIVNLQLDASEASRSSVASLIGQITLGWRFRISDFSFGLAGGTQYFMSPQTHAVVQRSGFLPSVLFDVGFIF